MKEREGERLCNGFDWVAAAKSVASISHKPYSSSSLDNQLVINAKSYHRCMNVNVTDQL